VTHGFHPSQKPGRDTPPATPGPADRPPPGAHVDVVLTGAGEQPVRVMRELRRCLGMNMREARACTKAVPVVVAASLDPEPAGALATAIRRAGGAASLAPPGTWPGAHCVHHGAAWQHVRMRDGVLGGWPCVVLRPARGGNLGHALRWGVLGLILVAFAAFLAPLFWLIFSGVVASAISSAIVSVWALRREPWPSFSAMIVLWHLGGGERIGRDAHDLIIRRRLFWGVRTTRVPLARLAALIVDPEAEDAWIHHWRTGEDVVMLPTVSAVDAAGEVLGQFGYVVEPAAARQLIEAVETRLGLKIAAGPIPIEG